MTMSEKEAGLQLVEEAFTVMGGTVIEPAPRRPNHHAEGEVIDRYRHNFLMDFENQILKDWDARQGIPTGPRRFENPAWAALIKRMYSLITQTLIGTNIARGLVAALVTSGSKKKTRTKHHHHHLCCNSAQTGC